MCVCPRYVLVFCTCAKVCYMYLWCVFACTKVRPMLTSPSLSTQLAQEHTNLLGHTGQVHFQFRSTLRQLSSTLLSEAVRKTLELNVSLPSVKLVGMTDVRMYQPLGQVCLASVSVEVRILTFKAKLRGQSTLAETLARQTCLSHTGIREPSLSHDCATGEAPCFAWAGSS